MNRGNFALEGDDEMKRNCCGLRGRGFDDFSREDLRDIILHKNKVIADLEEHAYGSASWIENLNKGLKKANEIKRKVDKKPPKETDEEFKKRLEEFDKDKDAPTEAWGADELNGGMNAEEKTKKQLEEKKKAYEESKKEAEKLAKKEKETEEEMRLFQQQMELDRLKGEDADLTARRRALAQEAELKKLEYQRKVGHILEKQRTPPSSPRGRGAAPKAEPKPPSGVAVAAEALKPVREAIQNGIGDAIYGKSDDPKKQKKGLLGISEEGKEESKKKVMKNIVVPIVKAATEFGKNVKDTANMIFNPSQYDADMKDERIKRIKRDEAKAGIVRDKENPMIIIRKPRGYWTAETTDPTEEAYYTKRIASINRGAKTQEERDKDVFYVRVPNPIFAAKLRPSFKEFGDARIKLWTGVQQYDPKVSEDVDGTLKSLHDDEFIWLPEDRAKEIYGQLRQFVQSKEDAKEVAGFEDTGITKGFMKRLASIDPRTLKGQDLIDYKQSKLRIDDTTARKALEKVYKDIKDEMAKATPDQARLTKMREARERIIKRQQELAKRGQKEYQEATAYLAPIAIEKQRKRDEDFKREREEAQKQDQAEQAEFQAKPVAERLAQLEELKRQMEEEVGSFTDYDEQIEQLRAEAASEKVEEQAQGSVDLLQQAQVVGGSIPTNPALYEKAKAIVNKSYPKHSAYRSGAYVKKYKEMGGEYEDEPDGKRPLERWFKEDWKDVGNKEYPVYRPTKRISKDTPLTPDEIDPENLKLQVKEKQKIRGERNLSAFKKRGGAESDEDDEELVGAGAIEYTLTKAGKQLFNPSGDMTKAGRQSFTPDYDAYGDTVEEGRKNAFNLSRSMYDQSKAIELPDFTLIRDDTSLRFYKKHDENVILVGIRGTDVKSWTDLYTWAVIGANQDLRMTTRFQEDLAKMVAFQRNYPPQQFYYVATGSSLAGSIADRFLELGLIEEAITYNPSIERKYVLEEGILNHRVYLDTDPLFILMGQYAPNTEIRVNPNKTNFYNPSKEKDYLIASHSIYPVYNPAFEGGGMEGSGKTYTLEEWKAIFDAKLEEKRKAIEAREAKKKQTAKAKRERAKARRDAREKATPPKEPEPEPEEEEPEVEVEEYEMGDETYLVEAPREGLAFAERRVFDNDGETLGNLTEDDVGKTLVKMVMRREKLGAFADKSPKAKSSSESLPFFESQQPKAKEKKKKEPKAPASARVELREELVAEQPRNPAGEFAKEGEVAMVAVSEAPQRAYMRLLKSPKLTDADRQLMMNLRRSKMTPFQKARILGRSGLARKLMELLGVDKSSYQTPRDVKRIADTIEKRVEGEKVREMPRLPEKFKSLLAEWEKKNISKEAVKAKKVTFAEWYREKLETFDRTFGVAGTSVQVMCDSFETKPYFGLWFCQFPTTKDNNVMVWRDDDRYNRGDRHRRLVFEAEMTKGDGKVRPCEGRLEKKPDAPVLSFNTGEELMRTQVVKSVMPLFKECGFPVPELQDGFKGVNDKAGARWMIEWTMVVPSSNKGKITKKDDEEFQAKLNSQLLPRLKEKTADLVRLIDEERERLEDEIFSFINGDDTHNLYIDEEMLRKVANVKREQKLNRKERQRKMKEPEKEEEEEEEEEEYGDVEELMTEFRKLKKAYEVEDSKKFSSAVGKKMDALRKPAQDILEGYELLQDQLREGYFLDQNEYKIYFKIDDKDGLRFYSFERPDGKKIAFKNMRRGDDWNSATTDMTKEEWVFYRQSSLFKFDPSAYRNEPWKLFNDIIQFMSFFRSPANPQKLWEKYDDKATKKIGEAFKEWYEKDVMGRE